MASVRTISAIAGNILKPLTAREPLYGGTTSYIPNLSFISSPHDPKLPAGLRAEVNQWGLAKDEFADTDHWPHQLYVREARRMVGEYVMRQSDLENERTKSDSIGMGSYNIDSHNTQRVAMPDGAVQNEGDVQFPVEPYEISYRSITPKRAEAENLLVTVCLSATHVAYCSLRMEPQYMILGRPRERPQVLLPAAASRFRISPFPIFNASCAGMARCFTSTRSFVRLTT